MPVSLKRIIASGTLTLHTTCEECGEGASFGYGVRMREAFNALAKGDKVNAKKLLGTWLCGTHRT